MAYRGKYARQTKKSKLPVILLVFLLMAVCVLGACALFADDAAPPAADNPVETTQIPTETAQSLRRSRSASRRLFQNRLLLSNGKDK